MYLIIGASGVIGSHLYSYCKRNGIHVAGTYYSHSFVKEWIRFDLCQDDFGSICQNYFKENLPKAVIVCGANANIDNCKRDEYGSRLLNVEGTRRIFEQAAEMGVKSVFLSSEAVFDGYRGMYREEDVPNPLTLYGRQKLQIEEYMAGRLDEYLIFRLSRAVGSSFGEKDIFHEFYNRIICQKEIICLKEQSFCLTEVDDIACTIIRALESGINGVYHLASNNYITRFDLANIYAKKIFGGYGKILEMEYENFKFLDHRHIHGGLRGDRLAGLLGMKYMDIETILDRYKRSYRRNG